MSRQVEGMTDVGRDNTGARRYADGVALPTTHFPSDHAIVVATVLLAADEAHLSVAAAALHISAPVDAVGPTAGEDWTLYDYWGIRFKSCTSCPYNYLC